MRLFFLSFFFLNVTILGCSDEKRETNLLLQQPPYDQMTDSIERFPSNADLYYKRGMLLFQSNETDLAQQDFMQAWQLQQTEEHAIAVARTMIGKNTDSAINFLEAALSSLPQSVILEVSLARGYQQKNSLDTALLVTENILAKYPGQLDALLIRSEIFKEKGRDAEALQSLERAYQLAPHDRQIAYSLAFAYAEAKDARVLVLTDSLIRNERVEKGAEPHYFKGVYYSNLGNHTEALRHFDAAIREDFYFLDAYMDKGRTFYEQKKYNEAIGVFQLANRVSPTYADAYYWLAQSQEAAGNKAEAKMNYQRAFGLDKTFTEAKAAADRL